MLNVTLAGKRYRMLSRKLPNDTAGYCQAPSTTDKEIAICRTISDSRLFLEIVLHELLHAEQWSLDELVVTEAAADMARALTRLGATIDVAEAHRRLARPKRRQA